MNDNRLRILRLYEGLSLSEVSEQTGFSISADSLSKCERGDREPKLATWQKLMEYFDVSFEYLVGWTDERR